MLLFGHAGITLGIVAILANVPAVRSGLRALSASNPRAPRSISVKPFFAGFRPLLDLIDVRYLILGSLLPDIIDKPLGHLIFRESLSNGRIFAHTLLFTVLLGFAGAVFYRKNRCSWFLILAVGTFSHLLLDRMWRAPATLFWPFLGLNFAKYDLHDWLPDLFARLFADPAVYVPELIGFIIIAAFAWFLVQNRLLKTFLR